MSSSFRVALAVLAVLPAFAGAQASAVIDEGTFTISKNGAPLGRESFRIIRAPAPGGQVFLATGTSVAGEYKITTRLGTDSTGVPVSYDARVSQRGQFVQELRGRGRPGRFSVLAQTRTGEAAREYVLNNGALLLDEDVFNQYFFVGLAAQHAEIIVISPRSAQQLRIRLASGVQENVEVAGRTIPGRRFTLTTDDGSSEVWVDGQGRLLRIAIPAKGLVALRDDPPR